MKAAQLALDKAKISLMARSDSVFFATVCFSLKHEWDNTIPTACTNGVYIKFNPDFFMSLDSEERVFLLIHESCHVAYSHMARGSTYDQAKYNVAADHVINLQLKERGFKMPKMGLADPQYKGMSTEQVYKLLPEQKPENVELDIVPSDMAPEDLKQHVEDIIIKASIQSKMQGDTPKSIPEEIQIFLNGLLKPKLPWNVILQRYIQTLTKHDYTFRKPNRRFFPKYHLPSLYSETLMDIAIAVDSSGSVSDEEFKTVITEVNSIFRMMKPEKITLVQFDSTIKSVTELKNIHELSKVRFVGRGGTKIWPVIQWAEENKPQLLLVFSDGEFHFNNINSKIPTLWLIHNNNQFNAPFGKTITYKV